MKAELEKWIQENKTQDCEPESSMGMGFGSTFSVSEDKLRALFDGKVLVPVEPTREMLEAARDWSYKKYDKPIGNDAAQGCWKAMLAASQEKK